MKSVGSKLNVLGTQLKLCCTSPMTGWFRDGYCRTDDNDQGKHIVCAYMTADFLAFSKSRGNDLSTPRLPYFQGLKEGDKWCLCASRWQEAYEHGKAPLVDLEATQSEALLYSSLEALGKHAVNQTQMKQAEKLVN